MRAVLRVNALHRRLANLAVPTSLLLIDSGLWTLFDPLAVHAAGPRPGDVVILTSEPVLAALLDGRLPVAIALERNIVVVDGEAAAAATVRRLLAGALTPEGS